MRKTRTADQGGAAVRRPRHTRGIIAAGAVLLALVLGAGTWALASAREPEPTRDAVIPATAKIELSALTAVTNAPGKLVYAEPKDVWAGGGGVVTWLPAAGDVVGRGGRLATIGDQSTFLLYGGTPAWRSFERWIDDGPDVQQLEENLAAFGVFDDAPDQVFDWATYVAIRDWQEQTGQVVTGSLPLGSIVFRPEDVRVADVGASPGESVGGGTLLLTTTSLQKIVQADVPLSNQRLAVLDGPVTVAIPGSGPATGKISVVGAPTTRGEGPGARTVIPIVVALDDAEAVAALQEADVTVGLPDGTAAEVLHVPVDALLALPDGGFGVELVDDAGTTTVPVQTGKFVGGRVEITGAGLEAGMRVVVPER